MEMKVQLTIEEAERYLVEHLSAKLDIETITVKIKDDERDLKIKILDRIRTMVKNNGGQGKIQAIKYFRNITKWNLAESKIFVENVIESDEYFETFEIKSIDNI